MSSITGTNAAHTPGEQYQVGEILGGKYRLVSKAGEGATGTVWVATNTALQSNVAIKLVHPEMRLPVIVERVMREARAAARLTHSAIVRIFDLGETTSGDPYIVMELLEGESLRALLDREGRVAPERALALMLPIAGAMHSAHDRGIIHRDIKPDNIMLAQIDGGRIQPKIVDFGIAKLSFGDPGGVTTGALVIGTPGYMSPEQAGGGEKVDHRSDVWSVCATIYEMVSGVTPFPCSNTLEALCAVIRDPVPPLNGKGIIDDELWRILDRGLQKDPKDRWANMKTLGQALSAWGEARGVFEDVSGVPLRTLWLSAPTDHSKSRSSRLPPAGAIPTPVSRRARTEDVGITSSVHFASTAGYGEPSSRSRNAVMGGIAILAAVLAWKIALSPVGPATAAAVQDSASPAALITAAPVAVPPPAASTAAPVAPITAPAVTTTAAPAAPKATVAKPVRAPVRAPTTTANTAPSPLADEPTRLNGGPTGSVANARSSPYLTTPIDAGAVGPVVDAGHKMPGDGG
jgi:serine/threonine protein kinase